MLVLTRKLNESVVIGDDVVVTVVHLDRGKVRLGIVAPRHVNIVRTELLARGQGAEDAQPRQEVPQV